MRKLIVPAVLALTVVAFASSVYAGGAGCKGGQSASASGKSCHYGQTASLPEGLKVETFRMPSGALAVFYTSENVQVVKTLQEKAAGGADNFCCGICREMAQAKDCKVELVPFANGVMALVTAPEAGTIDKFEKQFAVLTSTQNTPVEATQ
jgi:hypothetical protein